MNKKNKILVTILVVIVVCIASLGVIHIMNNNPQKESDTPAKSEPTTQEVSGVVSSVGDHLIVVDGVTYTYTSDDKYYDGDEVAITYSESEEESDTIKVDSITLSKRADDLSAALSILSTMTTEEKVGQMFMVRCPASDQIATIQNYHPGGYILFDRDILPYTRDQFIANNQAYQANSKIPMLIGLDEEGGTVVRLSCYIDYRSSPFLSPQQLYNNGGFDLIRSDTIEKANLLTSVGVNVNFAPVADVSTDPNDYINARAFGQDGTATSQYITTVVSAMNENGVGSVLKHFPGYGNNVNTHTGSAHDDRSMDSFESQDFLPFKAGIEAGADSVLVNHNIVSCMDANEPASLSANVHQILRDELGFTGVIMTDDLIMQAITDMYGDDQSAIMAVNAGNDILLSSDLPVQYQAVLTSVQNGDISMERIEESVIRILRWKYKLHLIS